MTHRIFEPEPLFDLDTCPETLSPTEDFGCTFFLGDDEEPCHCPWYVHGYQPILGCGPFCAYPTEKPWKERVGNGIILQSAKYETELYRIEDLYSCPMSAFAVAFANLITEGTRYARRGPWLVPIAGRKLDLEEAVLSENL